jgi:cystathionine beta-lyase family protein involved in aluminum resistance
MRGRFDGWFFDQKPRRGLAPSGGYIVGRSHLVSQVADYITATWSGQRTGSQFGAEPAHVSGIVYGSAYCDASSQRGSTYVSGFRASWSQGYAAVDEEPPDIVQAVILNDAEQVRKFCQIVQQSSPVDSDLRLEYADMPGYQDKVIMAAGTFCTGIFHRIIL